MAWIGIALLSAATFWLLMRGRLRERRLMLVTLGTLALGLVGYALSGYPSLPSRPAPPPAVDPAARPEFAKAREQLLQNYGDVGAWLVFADALSRQGRSGDAIEGLKVALGAMPDSPDLWVGLGNALTVHASGMVTPAARLAFDRASQLAPDHPGPPYFLGLTWLQAGKPQEALAVWEKLRARSPADAPWVPDLERKMRGARAMIDAGVGTTP